MHTTCKLNIHRLLNGWHFIGAEWEQSMNVWLMFCILSVMKMYRIKSKIQNTKNNIHFQWDILRNLIISAAVHIVRDSFGEEEGD